MSTINEFSSNEDVYSFLSKLYDKWINSSYTFEDYTKFNKIFTIQAGKYIGYPNMTYIKLLYCVLMSDILSIREDEDLQGYRQFLIKFFMYLEENAISGIIPVRNKDIIMRLKFLQKELKLTNMDTNSISNTHIIMILL